MLFFVPAKKIFNQEILDVLKVSNDQDVIKLIFDKTQSGDTVFFTEMKKLGLKFDFANNQGNTIAHIAAFHAQDKIIDFLVAQNFNFNATNIKGETPAHIAAAMECVNVLIALERVGADFRITNGDGKTPLDIAREQGKTKATAALESMIPRGIVPLVPIEH